MLEKGREKERQREGERRRTGHQLGSTAESFCMSSRSAGGTTQVMLSFYCFSQDRQYFTCHSPSIISTLKYCHCFFIINGLWGYRNNVTGIKRTRKKIYTIKATRMVGGTLNFNCHTHCLQSCSLFHILHFSKGP